MYIHTTYVIKQCFCVSIIAVFSVCSYIHTSYTVIHMYAACYTVHVCMYSHWWFVCLQDRGEGVFIPEEDVADDGEVHT